MPVAGRFQTFHAPDRRVTAIVDYAHTPDAVVNVITAIREVVGTTGKIITVVGAGGNRDKGKRPIMASEAARLSDRVILTSDNPRFENPLDILADMEEGIAGNPDYRARTLSIADRRQAIRTAVTLADDGDVVLVAGKGHEDYQAATAFLHECIAAILSVPHLILIGYATNFPFFLSPQTNPLTAGEKSV